MTKRSNKQSILSRAVSLAVASTLVPAAAMAVQLEEIVVTAQKRSESLQDVPVSVIAMSGDDLASLNRNEVAELSKSIAGFTFQTGSGDSEKAIQIRGVGTSTFSRGVEQSVGTVIDGVVASSLVASFLDFNDVERVEVLRGPQGMLFGKNASSGMLNIATKKPTYDLSYGASASFSEENERKYSAYISGGLSETIAGRLSYYSNTRDGYIDNDFPGSSGEYNNRDEWGASGKLLLEPSDDLSVLLAYTHSERDYDCCWRPVIETSPTSLYPSSAPQGEKNDKTFEIQNSSPNTADVDVTSIEVNYELGENTLTSITSYTDSLTGSNVLAVGLPLVLVPENSSIVDVQQFTQELRITSPADKTVTYVAGLYYYTNDLSYDQTQIYNIGGGAQQITVNGSTVENKSMAIFGQSTWHMSDVARLSLGLRYNDDNITIDQDVTRSYVIAPVPTVSGSRSSEADETNLQWRIIAEYDVADDKMVYGTVSRGYKGPGANTLSSGVLDSNTVHIVEPEIPTNYEVGLKSEWLDGSLRLNVSAFLTEFEDFQASLSDNQIPASFYLANAGELETKGLELEVTWQASENLLVTGNIASIDASFKEFVGAECYPGQTVAQGCTLDVPTGTFNQDLSGSDLPFSPDLTVNLFARYDIILEDAPFNAYVQGAYHWQDEAQLNSTNDPKTLNDSYGLADFALGIVSEDEIYEAQIFVKNAFDKFYRSGYSTQGTSFGVLLAHSLEYDYTRRVGVKFSMNF